MSLLQAVSPKYRDIVNKCLEETTNEMIALIQDKFIRTRRGKDGKILTIDIRYLMKQQKLFGAISRSKLASKLQREGIEIKVDDPQHGFYHVKGISRDIENKFSTRTAEIEAEKAKSIKNGKRPYAYRLSSVD